MKEIERERQMIRSSAAKAAQRIDQIRAREIDASGSIPRDLVETFGKQGFLSLLLPEEYGGTGGDMTSFCWVIEEIAKACASSSLFILVQGMGTMPILLGGNLSQKERYFRRIADENHLTAFVLEEEGMWDPNSLGIEVECKGQNYVIRGRNGFVMNGSVANSYSIFARTRSLKGEHEISAFIVEQETPGLRFGKEEEKLGMKGVVTAEMVLDHCEVSRENLLGEEGEGWRIAKHALNRARPAIGALATGIAERALETAMRYSNERIQFGKPLSSFQAIRFMIADMATQIEAARTLVYEAAGQIDEGVEGAEKICGIAKIFASDMAMKVTTDAVQILGGYGYMKDYPLERMMRDAKVTQIYGGANQFHKLEVAQKLFD